MFERLKNFINKKLKTVRKRLSLGIKKLGREAAAARQILLRLGRLFGHTTRFSFTVLMLVLIIASGLIPLMAFEAHIINVTAEIWQIDPPVLTAPGDIGWDNTTGGSNLAGIVDVVMTDADPDAIYIYYAYGPGLDPLTVPTPVCGQTGPNGGGGLKVDVELVALSLTSDTVIKAIACDGDTGSAHSSVVNTKIYDFIDYACIPQIVSFPTNLAVLAAGPGNSSGGDIFVSANVDINGDARSNDDINANGGGANRFINGNATAGDTIEVANFTISGTITEGAALTTLPDINIPLWEDKANDGGTVNGSLIFPNSTSGIELGPTEVMGNVTFEGSNTVTIKGPMYIHGNLVIEQNTTITQDAGFGNQFATIIVDGTIDIDNNVEFIGNGSGAGSGAFLLVSNAVAQSGDNAAIEISNDSNPLGDVVLYATNGDVHIGQNRVVLAIFATVGTSNIAPAIDLDSNVTVDYRALSSTISCGSTFTPIEQLLINEFLPNPIGDDQGTAGGPLDGEFVELYNGSGSAVDVNGYVLYDDFVPAGAAASKVWTADTDFNPGTFSNTFVETSGDDSVRVTTGQTSGTYETVLDAGEGNRGDWQNLTWTESLSAGADICLDVATSNDGISYTAFSLQDCGSPFSLTGIADSRFIKWRSTHTRTSGLVTNNADLTSLTITYTFFNYHELVITSAKTNTGFTLLPAGGLLVVYREGDTDFDLDNDGTDTVKLYNNHVWLGGIAIDSRAYNYGGTVPDDKSFTRMPDGTANWVDPDPTPGQPNEEFVDPNTAPTEAIVFESEPLAEGEVEEIVVVGESVDFIPDFPFTTDVVSNEPIVLGVTDDVTAEPTVEDATPATEVAPAEELTAPEPIVESAPEEPAADITEAPAEEPTVVEQPIAPAPPPDAQPDNPITDPA